MKLVAAVVVLCFAGCERKKPVEKTPEPAPPVEDPTPAVAPEPPKAGTAEIEVSGAAALVKKGTGTSCDFGKSVGSQELDGFEAKPAWRFWLNENANDPKLANASLSIGETEYEWTGDGAKFTPYDGKQAIDFDGELKSKAGATVRVRARLTCPSFPALAVPKQVAAILKKHTKREPRAYSTFDFGRAQYPAAASVLVPEAQAHAALAPIRAELPAGYTAHVGTNRFLGEEQVADGDVELVVAPGANQLDIIRTARTDAVNYGISGEAIIKRLESWDRAHGIDIVLANVDTIAFALKKLPADVGAFAKEVYAFCPDTVDQGVGTLEALEKQIRETSVVSLWWD